MSLTLPGLLAFYPIAALAQDWQLPVLDGSSTNVAISRKAPVAVPQGPQGLLDLTDIALRNNPNTQLAWATVRAQAAALGVARAAYWPQLSATLSITHGKTSAGTTESSRAVTRYGPAISLSYLLWDFGARSGATDAAKAELIGARLTRNQTFQDVILEVEQRYYQVQGLITLSAANQKSVDSAHSSLAAAKKRRKSGLSTVGDVYRAEASLAQAKMILQQTRGNLGSARGALASAVGFSPATHLQLQPWSPTERGAAPAQTVNQVLVRARGTRPQLLAAKAAERAARAHVRQIVGAGLPTVSLNASAGRTHITHRGGMSDYTVGAQVDVPLFAGFGPQHAREQAQAQVEQAQASSAILLQQVETEVWQAYQNVQTARQTMTSSAALLKSAKRSEAVALGRYKNGLDTIVDLLTAQATLADARASRVQAQLDYYSALAVLGHAAGGLGSQTDIGSNP